MNTSRCEKCGVSIKHKRNEERHLLSQRHLRNDPDQTIKPQVRKNKVTRKELLLQAKEYNLKSVSKLNKQLLLSVLSKAETLLIKTENLEKLKKRTKKHR